MSGILERTTIIGKVRLSGKRERFVFFPWNFVSAGGDVSGWEPAEWNPMGRVSDIDRLSGSDPSDELPSKIEIMDYDTPYFYDVSGSEKTLLHGGHVQVV